MSLVNLSPAIQAASSDSLMMMPGVETIIVIRTRQMIGCIDSLPSHIGPFKDFSCLPCSNATTTTLVISNLSTNFVSLQHM